MKNKTKFFLFSFIIATFLFNKSYGQESNTDQLNKKKLKLEIPLSSERILMPSIDSDKKEDQIILIQNKALELSLFLSIPATIALLIASEEIVSALFGYGTFDEDDKCA